MKRNTKIFWRAFFISFTIVLSLVIVIIGMFESYKNMQKINVYNSKTATVTGVGLRDEMPKKVNFCGLIC